MIDAGTGKEITTFTGAATGTTARLTYPNGTTIPSLTTGVPMLGKDGTLYMYILDSELGWFCYVELN